MSQHNAGVQSKVSTKSMRKVLADTQSKEGQMNEIRIQLRNQSGCQNLDCPKKKVHTRDCH